MKQFIEKTEKGVLWVLAFLLLGAVLLGTVDLTNTVVLEIIEPPFLSIAPSALFHMFGSFLIILMGLKLIKLILLSLPGESAAAVVEVALIGVGQKVVTLDVKTQTPATLLGMAALILALAVAYIACRQRGTATKGRSLYDREVEDAEAVVSAEAEVHE